jgi:RNA polymerase sigma-70 factor (ECF subfamily)
LTIDQRTVLVLHFYLGLELAEVAGILDVPIGTAKSRLHRGLAVLRDSMRPPPIDGLTAEHSA